MARSGKVCLITDAQLGNPASGVGQVVWRQAVGLAARNWEVHVVCPTLIPSRFTLSDGYPPSIHPVNCSATSPSRELGEHARTLIEDREIGVVIAHGLTGLHLFRRTSRTKRTFRAIAHIQHLIAGETYALFEHNLLSLDGVARNFGRFLALALEYKLTKSAVDNYVVPSEFTGRELAQVYHLPPSKIAVVPNGVDTNVFHPRQMGAEIESGPESHRRILYVGRLEARKGVTALLNAFAMVSRKRSDVRLVMVGDGPARRPIERLATRLRIASHLTLVEGLSQTELAQYYHEAHLVVIPSLYEGFGLVLLEALASGAQVLPASIPPFKEIAGEFGCNFVPPADAVQLAQGIENSLEKPRERPASEPAFQRLVSRYNWSNATNILEMVLRKPSAN